jgi:hypothetical protein
MIQLYFTLHKDMHSGGEQILVANSIMISYYFLSVVFVTHIMN